MQVGGQALPATVVAFSPDLDLAVLHVPGLAAPALVRSEPLAPEAPVAVAGFPGGGPYTVTSGRVAGTVFAISLVDAETTDALTNAQSAAVIDGASTATAEVSTQGCTP